MAEGGCILEAAVELVRCADCRTGPAPEAARLRALAPQPYAEAAPRCGAASAYGDHEGARARPQDARRPLRAEARGRQRGSAALPAAGHAARAISERRLPRPTSLRQAPSQEQSGASA